MKLPHVKLVNLLEILAVNSCNNNATWIIALRVCCNFKIISKCNVNDTTLIATVGARETLPVFLARAAAEYHLLKAYCDDGSCSFQHQQMLDSGSEA